MPESKHTRGPWIVEGANVRMAVEATFPPIICTVRSGSKDGDHPYISATESDANAARIVACVNACDGVSKPEAIPDIMEAATALCTSIYHGAPTDDDVTALRVALERSRGSK